MPDDSVADPSIDLKKRARRRLVGAAALALVAAIVLPIVMDNEPKPAGQEIQIRIPSKEGGSFAARVMPVRPSSAQRAESDKLSGAATAGAEMAAGAAAAKTASPSPDVAPAPVVDAKPKADPVVAKSEASSKAEASRAEAVLEGKDPGQWVVQLGAYQNAVNVKQLTSRLKEMGLPSYTERFDSPQGPRTRVRAGPFKSREAADNARSRIRKIGVDGAVAQK